MNSTAFLAFERLIGVAWLRARRVGAVLAAVVGVVGTRGALAQPVAIYDAIGPDPTLLNGRGVSSAQSSYPIEIHGHWAMSPVVVVPAARTRLTAVQFGHARGVHGNPGPTGCGHWEVHIWTSAGVIAGQPVGPGFFGDFRNERIVDQDVSVSGQVGVSFDGLRDIYVCTLDVSRYNIELEAGEDYAIAVVADDAICQGSGGSRSALVTYSPIPRPPGEPPHSVYYSGPIVGGTGLVQTYVPTDPSPSPTNRFAYRIMGEPMTPPCQADINGSGGITVQDIFDFLAFFFASDPRGDFNGVGGHTSQDIFDFLAAYFAGCA